MHKKSPFFFLGFIFLILGMNFAHADEMPVLIASNFEKTAESGGWPAGWPRNARASWLEEDDNGFIRLEAKEAEQIIMLYREIGIPEGAEALELSFRLRVTNLQRGQNNWFDTRVMMEWMDGGRAKVSPNPPAPNQGRNTDGWVERVVRFNVPEGARTLKFMPSLFRVNTGTFDLDDVVLKVIPNLLGDADPVQAQQNRVVAQVQARQTQAVITGAPEILYSGRRSKDGEGRVHLSYSGSRVRLAFRGEGVSAWLRADASGNFVNLYVNGVFREKRALPLQEELMTLAAGLPPEETHTVEIVKATEGFHGAMIFGGFVLPPGGEARNWPREMSRRILFIGDSIICGYGIESDGPENPYRTEDQNFRLGFAGRAARALDADCEVVARSGIGFYRNYNGPKEGSPDSLPALFDRIHFRQAEPEWDFAAFQPQVICINLGTNDFSTTGGDVERFVAAGSDFLKRLKSLYPESRIVLVSGPMEQSAAYSQALRDMLVQSGIPETHTTLFPLSPQGRLGFGTHWHPSVRQGEKNGQELSQFLEEWMGEDWGSRP
ncbi:MAG: GDSL-type esterase/lipase family protein [Opitutales bacterium]